MRIYIAGPMTGIEGFNYPAFNEAAARIEARGHEPLNPAQHDLTFAKAFQGQHDLIRAHYMRLDIDMIVTADALALLPGWQNSKGAALEVHIAEVLGIALLDAATFEPYSESILEEAQRLVMGARQSAYGHPADDFSRTGRMWGAILGIPDVAAEKVGLCMAAVKISREVNGHKRDNLTDLAGYAQTVDLVHQRYAEGNE